MNHREMNEMLWEVMEELCLEDPDAFPKSNTGVEDIRTNKNPVAQNNEMILGPTSHLEGGVPNRHHQSCQSMYRLFYHRYSIKPSLYQLFTTRESYSMMFTLDTPLCYVTQKINTDYEGDLPNF